MAKKAAVAAPAAPNSSLGLDDAPIQPQGEEAADRGRQGDQGRPYCERHLCLMTAASSRQGMTVYACPVPSCTCTEKKARPVAAIPAAPRRCPQRICAGNEASYLEVDPARSQGLNLLMKCPVCGHTQHEPRPTAKALMERQIKQAKEEEPAEDLSAR
jgi:hypothetical protein